MFDPFKDFATAGYLRNNLAERDARIVKQVEHALFTRNLPQALKYLESRADIAYEDFLEVHRQLFSEFYPWAGQDRAATAQSLAISKAGVVFCHPADIRRAVDEGLRLAAIPERMTQSPGLIMGLFAYAHPFLDGNGRTMLLVHHELAHRSGFSIRWAATTKQDYLRALSEEIAKPQDGFLDRYLAPFKDKPVGRDDWGKNIGAIDGLNGFDEDNKVDGDVADADVAKKYQDFERRRGYHYEAAATPVCDVCHATPCVCPSGGGKRGLASSGRKRR